MSIAGTVTLAAGGGAGLAGKSGTVSTPKTVVKGPVKPKIKGTAKSNFGSAEKLENHYIKHGKEFKGAYKNSSEYLKGAQDVIDNGYKIQYQYKGEIRTGYVKFMGNTSKGIAKFEFVGTNVTGEITTYHARAGKGFWKMINGENIPVINVID